MVQPKTALTALHLAELRPVDPAADSRSLLTEPEYYSPIADPFPKHTGGFIEGWLRAVV